MSQLDHTSTKSQCEIWARAAAASMCALRGRSDCISRDVAKRAAEDADAVLSEYLARCGK